MLLVDIYEQNLTTYEEAYDESLLLSRSGVIVDDEENILTHNDIIPVDSKKIIK